MKHERGFSMNKRGREGKCISLYQSASSRIEGVLAIAFPLGIRLPKSEFIQRLMKLLQESGPVCPGPAIHHRTRPE